MNRGNRKALIFEDDRDRRRFVRILIATAAEYGVEILLGCLMGNHFHLIVLTPHGNLSEFMQQLEGRFAKYVNWRHRRKGHVFEGRFTGVIIENDIHLFIAAWYVFVNPVAAGLVSRPEDWKWSTYASTAGLSPMPEYLSTSWLEVLFPSSSLSESQALFRTCMTDAQPVASYIQLAEPAPNVTIRSYITKRLNAVAQPCSYRTLSRPPLEELFRANQSKSERASTIQAAHERHGYKLAEIAPRVGLHAATISKIYCDLRREQRRLKLGSDPKFNREGWLKLVPDPKFNVDRARARSRGSSRRHPRKSRG
jgi:REP element-mobilizing transposase RayT